MSTLKTAIITASLMAATSATAFAHDQVSINRTQAAQQQEIEHQRRIGQLTRHEYRALLAEQARIADIEQRAQADGYLSGREWRAIREAQRDAGAHIYQESHDSQLNWWRRWKTGNGRGY